MRSAILELARDLATRLTCDDGGPRGAVELESKRGVTHVRAGLVGADGWQGETVGVDAVLELVVTAVQRWMGTLTLDRLVSGRRYRVLESLKGLRQGEVVRLLGFDDVDNHYGAYVFVTVDGAAVRVDGDFSTPRCSVLAETHRYLEELED